MSCINLCTYKHTHLKQGLLKGLKLSCSGNTKLFLLLFLPRPYLLVAEGHSSCTGTVCKCHQAVNDVMLFHVQVVHTFKQITPLFGCMRGTNPAGHEWHSCFPSIAFCCPLQLRRLKCTLRAWPLPQLQETSSRDNQDRANLKRDIFTIWGKLEELLS